MNKKKNKSGMTLVETIVAFAIIAIILVVAMMSINTIAGVNVKAQNMNKADEAMEARIALGEYETAVNVTMIITVPDPENQIEIELSGQVQTFVNDNNSVTLDLFQKDES